MLNDEIEKKLIKKDKKNLILSSLPAKPVILVTRLS